jgi:membrane dipeptidase
MHVPRVAATLVLAAAAALAPGLLAQSVSDQRDSRAQQVHQRAIVIDGHADTPQRLLDSRFDIAVRHDTGNLDIPRMREGGLDAVFFSIWVPGTVRGSLAVKRALVQIEAVRSAVRAHPNDLVLATTAAEIRRAAADGKIAALMGVEGGHMIRNDLGVLRTYASLGVRYLTLTHNYNTEWADAATAKPRHDGLTAFGKDVVRELNRLGVMVDISHVSDKTFADVLDVTAAPVIASHSSCRVFSNSARNMTDDMIRALAKNGGVMMINYNAAFLSEEFRAAPRTRPYVELLRPAEQACGQDQACRTMATERINQTAMRNGLLPRVNWDRIVDHIDHAVKIAGVDHVGLGSDFDGATMPLGMEDASKLPQITDALLKRGYSEANVEKILGGNLLRVMDAVKRLTSSAATEPRSLRSR